MRKTLLASALFFASALLIAPATAQTECPPIIQGSVLNAQFLPPVSVNFSGSFTLIATTPGTCGGGPCTFVWRVTLTVHSPSVGQTFDLCAGNGTFPPAFCGSFSIPGTVQPDGSYLQTMDTTQLVILKCGESLQYEVICTSLGAPLPVVKVSQSCTSGC